MHENHRSIVSEMLKNKKVKKCNMNELLGFMPEAVMKLSYANMTFIQK